MGVKGFDPVGIAERDFRVDTDDTVQNLEMPTLTSLVSVPHALASASLVRLPLSVRALLSPPNGRSFGTR